MKLFTNENCEKPKENAINEEEKNVIKTKFSAILSEMEEKKNKIIGFSINMTLKNLKEIIERFEREDDCDKISLQEMKLGMQISRAVVEKAVEEYNICSNTKEKPLYLM